MFETQPRVVFDTTELLHGFPHTLQANSWITHQAYCLSFLQCPLQFIIQRSSRWSLVSSQLEHLPSAELVILIWEACGSSNWNICLVVNWALLSSKLGHILSAKLGHLPIAKVGNLLSSEKDHLSDSELTST